MLAFFYLSFSSISLSVVFFYRSIRLCLLLPFVWLWLCFCAHFCDLGPAAVVRISEEYSPKSIACHGSLFILNVFIILMRFHTCICNTCNVRRYAERERMREKEKGSERYAPETTSPMSMTRIEEKLSLPSAKCTSICLEIRKVYCRSVGAHSCPGCHCAHRCRCTLSHKRR